MRPNRRAWLPKQDCSEAATAYFCEIRISIKREPSGEDVRRLNFVRFIKPQVAGGPGAFFVCVAATSYYLAKVPLNGVSGARDYSGDEHLQP